MKLILLLVMLPFLIPIVLAVLFILRLVLKGKAEGFRGKVIDKLHTSKRDDEHRHDDHFYTLVIRTEEGKERKIAVASSLYGECEVGDTIEKPKGALFPRKVTS